ncbi:conserved protein of unknown function [Methanoculleus bourgensis]|uniref:PPC domain-containing protein n=1 Tax=Methanoculleus bourgensis TaxID=83986 RepID=A0A0X3BK28_9EURY|nr:DUF296 domain-containing protein [Methanoculleus bourgensis]CVK31884.1 conserved protein of unknown function [Methanoculleus bourgensis]
MQYSEGQIGRVFPVRIDDREDFISEVRRFVAAMNIQSGMIHFLGAVRSARIVTGPKEPVIPRRRGERRSSGAGNSSGLPPSTRGRRDRPSISIRQRGGGSGRSPGAFGRRRRST